MNRRGKYAVSFFTHHLVLYLILFKARPCPFYSQGKCYFAKNCSFLHQAKSTPIVIRTPAPDNAFSQQGETNTGTTLPASEAYAPRSDIASTDTYRHSHHYSNIYAEQHDSDTDTDTDTDTEDDDDSPTIRKHILSSTANIRESGISRDSVATVKGDSYGTEHPSHTTPSSSYSLSYYHQRPPSVSYPKLPQKVSVETGLVPSSLHQSAVNGSRFEGHTPTSAISTNAQELEVPVFGGPMRIIPPFTLV